MAKIIAFPVTVDSEKDKLNNLFKVLNERLEEFDGSDQESDQILKEIQTLQSKLSELSRQIRTAQKSA